ncbi:LPS export ABC transporter periplasmic protein LptC [Cysteiniphilum halobium]|uniref:LPS export ABC transporter periplasmic protein LptC n=1 Tax=Cysteiniphilum halobium TaxID=2219059 RepID=UPI003F826F5F
MFFSKRVFFTTIGLVIVIGTSGWLVVKSAQEQISHGDLPAHFIENTAKSITYEKYDTKGWLEYKATAVDATRFYNQDAKLSTVNAVLYSKDTKDKPWNITANYADITNNNNNMHLYGNVVMLREDNGKNSPAIKIATDSVYYDDNKDYMSTDKQVTISQPGTPNNTIGTGMDGTPKKGDFKLLKNVRSYYVGQ